MGSRIDIRSCREIALVAGFILAVPSCATKPSALAPMTASSSASLPSLPPFDACAPEDAGFASAIDGSPNVAIDSDLPDPGDARNDQAHACRWPPRAAAMQTCASVFHTEERTDVAPHEKARLFGILVLRGKTAALTEFEAPSIRVTFDAWPDCEGDAPVAIEGNLEPTGEPLWSALILGPLGSPYRLEHAKVLGSAKSVCKDTPYFLAENPFDRHAVGAALAAVKLDDCNPHTAQETGHAKITFNPSGTVLYVELDSPPSGGQVVARCIRARFATVRIPAFGGGQITVGKAFVLP